MLVVNLPGAEGRILGRALAITSLRRHAISSHDTDNVTYCLPWKMLSTTCVISMRRAVRRFKGLVVDGKLLARNYVPPPFSTSSLTPSSLAHLVSSCLGLIPNRRHWNTLLFFWVWFFSAHFSIAFFFHFELISVEKLRHFHLVLHYSRAVDYSGRIYVYVNRIKQLKLNPQPHEFYKYLFVSFMKIFQCSKYKNIRYFVLGISRYISCR